MAETKKVRIGFVGVGGMGQMAHLRNYVNLPECEVAALAEVRPETGKLVARRYGVPKVYPNHHEMLAHEQLDGLVASQPFTFHWKLVPELVTHARFLFTEKPIAVSVEAGENLAQAGRQAGCTHMVGYHKRSDPAVMYARTLIDEWKASGEFGPLRYVRLTMPPGDWVAHGFTGLLDAGEKKPAVPPEPLVPYVTDTGWKDPYVVFVNYYIHQVNLMRHLLGEPYRLTFADKSGVLLAVESASGVTGTLEMAPYNTSVDWEETALVSFEKGYILIRLPAPLAQNRPGQVEVFRDKGKGHTPERTIPTLPWVHAMHQQAVNFVKVIRGEMPPPCSADEAVEDLRVAREYIRMWKGY